MLPALLFLGDGPLQAAVGASFLTLDPSPRIASMGGAGTAAANDISSLNINPAGFSLTRASQLAASHTQLFEETSFDSVAFSRPFGEAERSQSLALGAVYLSQSAIQGRDDTGNETSSFNASNMAVNLSYGRSFGNSSVVGVTAKALQEKIGGYSATGMAFDIGAQRPSGIRGLNLGVAVTNLGPAMKFSSEKYSLPTTARLGASYSVSHLVFVGDVNTPLHGGKNGFSLGTEFSPVQILTLRSGYLMTGGNRISNQSTSNQLSKFAGFAAGVGLKMGNYALDYAMVPHEELGYTQKIGFSVTLR